MKKVLLAASGLLLLAVIVWAAWPSGDGTDEGKTADEASEKSAVSKQLAALEDAPEAGDGGRRTVHGQVLDHAGNPVAGAKVEVWREPPVLSTNCSVCNAALIDDTDSEVARQLMEAIKSGKLSHKVIAETVAGPDGKFEIQAPTGETTLYASDGSQDGWMDFGDDEDELELSVEPMRVTHLKVVAGIEEATKPVPNARLFVASRDSLRWTEVFADSSGFASVNGLEGNAGLWVFAEAKGFGQQVVPLVETDAADDGERKGDAEVRMMPARALLVRTSSGGKPVDATVSFTADGHPKSLKAHNGEARFEELTTWELEVTATLGGLTSPKKIVSLDQEVTELDLELRSGARLLLTVLDEGGQPIDSSIMLNSDDDSLQTQSTEKGEVVVMGPVAEGSYTLNVNKTGYRLVERQLDLKPGDNAVEVVLHKSSGVSGVVLDESGNPVQGATVEAHVPPNAPSSASTDQQGKFELEIEEAGPVELKVSQSERGRAEQHVSAPASNVVVKLAPHARLKVKVIQPENKEEHAMVIVTRRNSQEGALQTDENGEAHFAGLDPGEVEVTAISRRMTSPAKKLTVEEGRTAEATLTIDPGLKATGVVVDETGKPVKNISLMTSPIAGNAESGDDGRFELDSLEANVVYTLEVSDEAMTTAAPVMFKAGQQLKVVLTGRPKVSGRVVDSRGAPLPSFEIEGNTIEAADGRFSVPARVSDGQTFLVVSAKDHKTWSYEGPYKPDLGDVVLEGAHEVSGVVVDQEGKPVSGAVVSPSSGESSVTTGVNGTFRLKLVEDADTVTAKRGQMKGTVPLELGRELRISLAGATHVSGRVIDAKGQPVAAVVTARDVEANSVKVEAGSDGRFAVELASGPWVFYTRISMAGQLMQISGPSQEITLGAPPGTCGVMVKADGPLTGVVLLPGEANDEDLMAADNKPGAVVMETYGASRVRAAGLTCGTYTLFASFNAETARQVVQVRSQELLVEVTEPLAQPEIIRDPSGQGALEPAPQHAVANEP